MATHDRFALSRGARTLGAALLALPMLAALPACSLSHAAVAPTCDRIQATATLIAGSERVRLATGTDFEDLGPSLVCPGVGETAETVGEAWWGQYIPRRIQSICASDPDSSIGRRLCARGWCVADLRARAAGRMLVSRGVVRRVSDPPDPSDPRPFPVCENPAPGDPLDGPSSVPRLGVSPGGVAFGTTAVGTQRRLPVTLSNRGPGEVRVLSFEVDLGNEDFERERGDCVPAPDPSGGPPALLLPGSGGPTCTLTAVFAPRNGREKTGSLRIDTDQYPFVTRVPLLGTGRAGTLAVTDDEGTLCLSRDPAPSGGVFRRRLVIGSTGGVVTIRSVSLVPRGGTSTSVAITGVPPLPGTRITEGSPLVLALEAPAGASDRADVVISSNATVSPLRVTVVGPGGSCP